MSDESKPAMNLRVELLSSWVQVCPCGCGKPIRDRSITFGSVFAEGMPAAEIGALMASFIKATAKYVETILEQMPPHTQDEVNFYIQQFLDRGQPGPSILMTGEAAEQRMSTNFPTPATGGRDGP